MEIQVLNWIQGLRTPAGDSLFPMITALGNGGMIWIMLTVILLIIPRTRKSGFVLLAALIADLILCNGILKPVIARTRPFDLNPELQLLIAEPTDFSFPSGHTAASFASVTALYLSGAKSRLWKPAFLLAALIAFSRLYLYVHYPTDILGGIAVGCVSGYAGYCLCKYIQQRQTDKQGLQNGSA